MWTNNAISLCGQDTERELIQDLAEKIRPRSEVACRMAGPVPGEKF